MKFDLAKLSLLLAVAGGAAGQQPLSIGANGAVMGGGQKHHSHMPPGAPQPTGQSGQPGQPQQPAPQQPAPQQPAPQQPAPQGQTSTTTITQPTGGLGGLPVPTPPPSGNGGGGGGGDAPSGGQGGAGGGMTVDFINKMGKDVYVSYGSNAGGPGFQGNPTAGNMGSSTKVVMPTGWAGRVYVDTQANVDPQGTKFEGSTTGPPDIDVSYVDGYNMPMSCSVNGETIVGCNIDLFSKGTCPGQKKGDVCVNTANTADGSKTANQFFLPCVGAAYTFPNDNVANVSNLKGNYVVCCIGTSCPAPARQGTQANKITKRSTAHGHFAGGGDDPSERRRLHRQSPNEPVLVRRGLHGGSLLARYHRHAMAHPVKA